MIKAQDRIFQNLQNKEGIALEQSKKQGDWSEFDSFLRREKEDLFDIISSSRLRERDRKSKLVSEKWQTFFEKEEESFLVIDGSRGIPGDTVSVQLMTYEAYKIIEGAVLTAFILGIDVGYIYVPALQKESIQIIKKALRESYAAHFLGNNIQGTDFSFHLHLHFGSSEYVSYTESSLVSSLAGKSQEVGLLFEKPVLVHKVETIATIPTILRRGGDWFSSLGTLESTGTKVFSISGHVNKPCIIEEALGIPLKTMLDYHAGGVRGGWPHLNAVFPNGASDSFLPKPLCDEVLLSYEGLSSSSSLGNGAVVVVNRSVDLEKVVLTFLQFFLQASSSHCIFCVKKVAWCAEILENLIKTSPEEDRELIIKKMKSLSDEVEKECLCGQAEQSLSSMKGLFKYYYKSVLEKVDQSPIFVQEHR